MVLNAISMKINNIKQLNKKLTNKLFSLLKSEGVTSNYQIAQKVHIDESYLSKIKRGLEPLSMNTLLKICYTYKFDIKLLSSDTKKNKIILVNFTSICYSSLVA